jgi:hypothetical protein
MGCSLVLGNNGGGSDNLLAVIVNYDDGLKEIDSTGSLGDEVRAVIRRALVDIEITPGEVNTGTNQIDYTSVLQNGDVLCVQASNTGFATFDEDCKTIPTPDFGFVPITTIYGGGDPVRISFEMCQILTPNCGPADIITANFLVTDASGNTGTIQLIGTKNAMNAIDDLTFLHVDGVSEVTSIVTALGTVNVVKSFDPGYNVDENITVQLDVIDCEGWENIDPIERCTNAIMTHNDEYLMDHEGNFIAFIK